MAPVSGTVALCLCDNALVIHTHYSNGCWYKDLLTSGGGTAALGLNAACILRPLPSDCLPLQQPAPPLTTPLAHSAPLGMVRRVLFYNVCVCVSMCFLWVCTHACLSDIKNYELGCSLDT